MCRPGPVSRSAPCQIVSRIRSGSRTFQGWGKGREGRPNPNSRTRDGVRSPANGLAPRRPSKQRPSQEVAGILSLDGLGNGASEHSNHEMESVRPCPGSLTESLRGRHPESSQSPGSSLQASRDRLSHADLRAGPSSVSWESSEPVSVSGCVRTGTGALPGRVGVAHSSCRRVRVAVACRARGSLPVAFTRGPGRMAERGGDSNPRCPCVHAGLASRSPRCSLVVLCVRCGADRSVSCRLPPNPRGNRIGRPRGSVPRSRRDSQRMSVARWTNWTEWPPTDGAWPSPPVVVEGASGVCVSSNVSASPTRR